MNSICFVINKYLNPYEPNMLIFVQQLAWEMADLGKKTTIICPLPVNINIKYAKLPFHETERTLKGNYVDVYRPKTIGFGQAHLVFGKSPVALTTYFVERAALGVLCRMKDKPDVLYGHFLAPSGITVARLGRKLNIPAFFALGESHDTIGQFGALKAKKELESIDGVIAVSAYLKKWAVEAGVVSENKIQVFPNSVNSERFKKCDKNEARKHFGLPAEDVLVAFVGAFENRKGILQVCKAMESLDGAKLICAGKGSQQPYGEKCIFARSLKPEEVPIFNSCADIFVLPTLKEGCSNAIVEALACGLPVISSNLPFNDDILDESCSIRVNPEDVNEIASAIKKLVDDLPLREQMSEAAIEKAKELTLENRAKKIIEFIEAKIGVMHNED